MLEQLKAHFKDALLINEQTEQMDKYEWFYTKQGDRIGILKKALTEREKQLLSIFFIPMLQNQQLLTKEEFAWHCFVIQGDDTPLRLLDNHSPYYRFIHFQTKQIAIDQADFHEAVAGLLDETFMIIWENEYEGVIIEKRFSQVEEHLPFLEMIDTLSSDFYVTLHVFIGQTHPNNHELYRHFHLEKQYFNWAKAYIQTQTVYTIEDILPIALIHHHPDSETIQHLRSIVHSIDDELLETIKVFFQCDLNVSSAAKKLYMHRNSLQYRIDKFIEKTGIDIKHFKGAVAVYLAILATESIKKH
ncbi:Leucine-rich protein [Anoxybacillus sp. P3H1B]|uniref:PucR family transcriptional regulator n=1 Tax=Anoxybacillus sp. P3H1B TaxID=1769293 RepID=UPI00079815BA|nr:helix-turn-helix domain-containing protein [Anoxybacillus sp. P3H1B]KXG10052.1 Leucine-rich protein [Anoxybacillus sp. P3H1B]